MAAFLALALLGYSAVSVAAVYGALLLAGSLDYRIFGVAQIARFGFVPLLVVVACCAVVGVGARRVSARYAVRHARLLAAAASAFVIATSLDVVIVALAGGIDEVVNSDIFTATLRAVAVGVWVLAALVWGVGVVLVDRRRRAGLASLRTVVVTGLTMGALHVASWLYLASPLTPDANPVVF